MLSSEQRSLIRFLSIYLLSTLLLFALASWIYYKSSKQDLLDRQRESLKIEATVLKNTLRKLHKSRDKVLYYPDTPGIQTAIYDINKKYIFGNNQSIQPFLKNLPDRIYYRITIKPYFLGAAHAVLSKQVNHQSLSILQKNIFFFISASGIGLFILGYFLGRLFIAPMKESLARMNRFIQDTTHELNTPISTILTNIELIDALGKHAGYNQELKRIEIASRTLSHIYDDLTYLSLNRQYHRNIESINMSVLISERIIYFSSMSESKNLKISTDITKNLFLTIDQNDALRLIDNLLSNAIKYNRQHGKLEACLDQDGLIIRDSGIGIEQEKLKEIFQRFKRADSSEGGFGIGLHIVSKICQYYEYKLKIDSIKNQETKVEIKWSK